jgi:hypothetical protein
MMLSQAQWVDLRQKLADHFSQDELRILCFDLDVDYEELKGEGKTNKAMELVAYLKRRGRIGELVTTCSELRPNVTWPKAPATSSTSLQAPTSHANRVALENDDERLIVIIHNMQVIVQVYLQDIARALAPNHLDEFLRARRSPSVPGRPLEWWEKVLETGQGPGGADVTFLIRHGELRDWAIRLNEISGSIPSQRLKRVFRSVEAIRKQCESFRASDNKPGFRQDHLRGHVEAVQSLGSELSKLERGQDP